MDHRILPPSRPAVQKGDRLLYETILGRLRYVLVIGTGIETNGKPVFDAMVLDGDERGRVVWGYLDQVVAIEERAMPMVVTFRGSGGEILDRVRVVALDDDSAIARARAVAIAKAQINGRAMPDTHNPTVGVDLNALDHQ